MCVSRVWLFATPWTVSYQAPLSMGILQARVLEWYVIAFSRGSSQPRDWTRVSCIAGRFFTVWATRVSTGRWNLELRHTETSASHLCGSCEWQGCSKRTLDCCCELLAAAFSSLRCLTVLLILWDIPRKANQGPILQPATEQKEPSLIRLRTAETSMVLILEKKRLKTCEN